MLLWRLSDLLGDRFVILSVGHVEEDGVLAWDGHCGCCARCCGVCAGEIRGCVD